MSTPRADRRWLSLSDVALREGVTERTIRTRVESARYPAPSRVAKDGPHWAAKDVDLFAAGEHPAFHPIGEPRRQWLAKLLDEARWWVWAHGSASIPTSAAGRCVGAQSSRLGPRVTKVRAAYREGRIPSGARAAFEALPGWSWDENTAAWQRRFDDVLSRWPSRLSAQDKAWLASQRARLDRMSSDRAAALRGVPGLVDYKGNRRVHEFVEAVTVWLDEHPEATAGDVTYASTAEVGGATVPVGRRAGYYRRRYLGKESSQALSVDEIALIESLPGWSWEQSKRHVAAALR